MKDWGLLIEELIVLRDNRPARNHALQRGKQNHPGGPGTERISWLSPTATPVTRKPPDVSPSVFSRQRLLSLMGTGLLPATAPCPAVSQPLE